MAKSAIEKAIAELKKLEAAERAAHAKTHNPPSVIEHRSKLAAYTHARKIVERLLGGADEVSA